jgi:hypothetical protein
LLLGLLLVVLSILLWPVQLWAGYLFTPWYVPVLATLAAVVVLMSLWRRRTIVRGVALVVCTLLAGFLVFAFVVLARVPPYTGPLHAGKPFPAFRAVRADGASFTQDELRGGQNTFVVFFRGRW